MTKFNAAPQGQLSPADIAAAAKQFTEGLRAQSDRTGAPMYKDVTALDATVFALYDLTHQAVLQGEVATGFGLDANGAPCVLIGSNRDGGVILPFIVSLDFMAACAVSEDRTRMTLNPEPASDIIVATLVHLATARPHFTPLPGVGAWVFFSDMLDPEVAPEAVASARIQMGRTVDLILRDNIDGHEEVGKLLHEKYARFRVHMNQLAMLAAAASTSESGIILPK